MYYAAAIRVGDSGSADFFPGYLCKLGVGSTSLRALTLPLNSPGTFIFLLGHLDMARKCWYVDVFFLSLVYDDVRLAVVAQLFGCVAFLLGRYHLF